MSHGDTKADETGLFLEEQLIEASRRERVAPGAFELSASGLSFLLSSPVPMALQITL